MRNDANKYLLSKGFIDGLDNKARRLFGTFVVVMHKEKIIYTSELFSFRATNQDLSWAELVDLLDETRPESRNEDIVIYENNLRSYIELNRYFQAELYPLDIKALERKLAQFCDEILRIKSIVFIDIIHTSKEGLLSLIPSLKTNSYFDEGHLESADEADGDARESGQSSEKPAGTEEIINKEVFMTLDPVLDPVIGIAASDISVGDNILCRLPDDSLYYSFFDGCIPDFTGTVKGEVSGVNITEYGSVIIAVNLAEGLSGVVKAPKWVRVRTADRSLTFGKDGKKGLTFEIFAAGIGMIVFLLALSLLVYFMS